MDERTDRRGYTYLSNGQLVMVVHDIGERMRFQFNARLGPPHIRERERGMASEFHVDPGLIAYRRIEVGGISQNIPFHAEW